MGTVLKACVVVAEENTTVIYLGSLANWEHFWRYAASQLTGSSQYSFIFPYWCVLEII